MNLVFCMAGLYKRFRDAGYRTPKFLLPLGGRTTLEHVVTGIIRSSAGSGVVHDVVFVANERDRSFAARVGGVLESIGLAGDRTAWVPDTRGQAHTALLGVDMLEQRGGVSALHLPLLVHNIDTIIEGRDFGRVHDLLTRADGYIDCIDADKEIYSFVAGERASSFGEGVGRATRIAEKIVISRNATTGLYGFRSSADYRAWCERTGTSRTGTRASGEFYISAVYQTMLEHGATVLFNTSHSGHATTIVGTPEEYEVLGGREERLAGAGGTGGGA